MSAPSFQQQAQAARSVAQMARSIGFLPVCVCGHHEYRHEYTPFNPYCHDCECLGFTHPHPTRETP